MPHTHMQRHAHIHAYNSKYMCNLLVENVRVCKHV